MSTQTELQQTIEDMIDGGAVSMAGSGMCTGGRIRHHLKHNIWNKRNSITLAVFQGLSSAQVKERQEKSGFIVIPSLCQPEC